MLSIRIYTNKMAYIPPHLRKGQFNYKFIKPEEKVVNEEKIQQQLNSDQHFPSLGKTIVKQSAGGSSYAEQAELARQKFEEEKMNSRIQAERERLRKERIEKQKLEDELLRQSLPTFKKKVVETVERTYREDIPQDDGWTTVERKKPKTPKQKINYDEVPEDITTESEHDSEGSETYWGPAGKEYTSWR